jgi:hypothetical protein
MSRVSNLADVIDLSMDSDEGSNSPRRSARNPESFGTTLAEVEAGLARAVLGCEADVEILTANQFLYDATPADEPKRFIVMPAQRPHHAHWSCFYVDTTFKEFAAVGIRWSDNKMCRSVIDYCREAYGVKLTNYRNVSPSLRGQDIDDCGPRVIAYAHCFCRRVHDPNTNIDAFNQNYYNIVRDIDQTIRNNRV